MSGDQRELDQAIEKWFTAEVDRVWRQYESGNHSGALVPAEASPEVRKSIQREILSGDAENRLASLTEDYRNGLYASALPATRRIVSSLSDPFDEGDQRFTAAAKKVMEALGIVEGARLEWA